MWDPGFQPLETVKARLDGYARRFCLRSVRHRGTAEAPGLVLGLDPDDSAHCRGLALAIDPVQHDEVMAYLRAREMGTEAYREAIVTLTLEDGRRVRQGARGQMQGARPMPTWKMAAAASAEMRCSSAMAWGPSSCPSACSSS